MKPTIYLKTSKIYFHINNLDLSLSNVIFNGIDLHLKTENQDNTQIICQEDNLQDF